MRTIPLIASTLLAAALTACSNSSDSSRADSTIKVSNQTVDNISSVSIRSASTGTQYYAGRFDCASGQESCRIFYTGAPIDEPTDLTFQDDRGVMVGAYRLGIPPGRYTAIELTPRTTGFYLIRQLLQSSNELADMSQAQREAIAQHFTLNYDSPDGTADYYEEIAANHAYRARKDGFTVDQYLSDLARRLLDYEIARAEEFLSIFRQVTVAGKETRALTETADASCSSALGNVLTISGATAFGVQGAFPIAGTVMVAAVQLFQSACDDTSSKLDAIDSKLNQLQLTLDSLADGLGELRNFTSQAAINTGEDSFRTLADNVERLASAYRVLKENYGVSSLREYVQIRGGADPSPLSLTLAKENHSGPLSELLDNFKPAGVNASGAIDPLGGNLLQQFSRLLQDGALGTIISAVKLQCDNPQTGDIIKLRVNCNLFLGSSVSRLVAAHRLASELSAEVYEVLDSYKTTDRDTVARYNYRLASSAADHQAALARAFLAQQDKLLGAYRSNIIGNPVSSQTGMYNTFRGLDSSLLSNIRAANCINDKLDLVAVTGWVKRAADEYLESQCRDQSTPVLARYYLTLNRNTVNSRTDICNVLGVLVPCSRLNVIDEPVRTFFAADAPLAPRLTPRSPQIGHFAVNPRYNRDRIGNSIASAPIPGSGVGLRLLNNPQLVEDRGVADLLFTRPIQHADWGYDPTGSTYYITWMRYTLSDNFNILFALSGRQLTRITNLVCATADCSVGEGLLNGAIDPQRGLNFVQGPQGLTLDRYGASITANDFSGSRELYGFFQKLDGRYLPIYPK
jgi:hypothetical protein